MKSKEAGREKKDVSKLHCDENSALRRLISVELSWTKKRETKVTRSKHKNIWDRNE